jgi:hypothetical protein
MIKQADSASRHLHLELNHRGVCGDRINDQVVAVWRVAHLVDGGVRLGILPVPSMINFSLLLVVDPACLLVAPTTRALI